MPEVGVLMPVYNAGRYLSESIESILSQSFTDFTFYIVDDGSTDDSAEIINNYRDARIRFIQKEKNSGIVETMNLALKQIREPFVARMDADDVALPHRLKEQYEFMSANKEVIICGTQVEYFGDINMISSFPVTDATLKTTLLFQNCFAHPSVMFRTEFMRHGYPGKYDHLEDYAAWIGLRDKGKFALLDKVLLKYRMEGQNISHKNYDTKPERISPVYEVLLGDLDIDATERHLLFHFSLCGHYSPSVDIEELINYTRLIIEKNKSLKRYPEKELKEFIDKKLDNYFFLCVEKQPKLAFSFWKMRRKINARQFRYWLSVIKNRKE